MATSGGRRGVRPAQQCSWFKDVVEDGDVHPHPGPSSSRCQHMKVHSINAGGAANAWAVARWACTRRPAVLVIQELCMNQAKQSDLAKYLLRNGYRSWFACPPTHGGVAVLVRHDKPAQLIKEHCCPEGQAVMLQLENAFIVSAYFSPNAAASDIAITVDEWVSSIPEHSPVFILGDFNEEPSFARRWSTIRGFGSVCTVNDSAGHALPTRWSGRRCIDWLWASHLHMVDHLHFGDEVFADHKVFGFSLHFSHDRVWAYKAVQTRQLAQPPDVPKAQWKQALAESWSQVSVPHETKYRPRMEGFLPHGRAGPCLCAPSLWRSCP